MVGALAGGYGCIRVGAYRIEIGVADEVEQQVADEVEQQVELQGQTRWQTEVEQRVAKAGGYSCQLMSVSHFSAREAQLILESFTLFDLDNDGRLSSKQVTALVRQMLGLPSEPEIYKLLSEVDSRHKGYLSREEFLTLMARLMMTVSSENDMRESFKLFELPGQRGISAEGLKARLSGAGVEVLEEEVANIVEELDEDEDGRVSYDEYKRLMRW